MALTKVKAGNIILTTPGVSSNDVTPATTQYVTTAIGNLIDTAPSTLNTLNELAAALGDDVNFSTTVTSSIATKLPLAGGTMTGGLVITAGNGNQLQLNNAGERFTQIGLKHSGAQNGALWLDDTDSMVDLYANTSHGIRLKTGGDNPRVTILSGGNVGIGTAAPYFPLHVQGPTGFNGEAKNNALLFDTASATTGTGGGIAFGGYTNGTGGDVYHFGNIQGIKENSTAGNYASAMLFSTRAVGATPLEQMRITSSGKVGIGTTAPSNLLSLKGQGNNWNTSPGMKLWDSTYSKGWYVGTANNQAAGDYYIRSVTSESAYPVAANQQFTITQGGNVGIGTIAPAYALEVNGQVKSAEGLHSNNWQLYNTGTNGFLIGTNISVSDYAHVHGEIKLQQFNYSTHQIIHFSATVAAAGVSSYAASSDIPVTIKLFKYAGTWYIWVPSPSNYSDISAYIHMGAGYQGTSKSSNAIISLSASGVPSSGVTNSVDIIAKIAVPGSVIQTQHATNGTQVVLSQTINTYSTIVQVNITPKYANSKILITGIAATEVNGGNYPAIHGKIFRDSTEIEYYKYWGYNGPLTHHRIIQEPIHFLDSPTTTSALTYYVKITNTSGSAYSGTYGGRGNQYNASVVTVQEIAQ